MVLHQPVQKHIFNVRATYQREADKAMLHLASIGITRVALIHTNDSFGADGAAGAQKGLQAAGLKPVLSSSSTGANQALHPSHPNYLRTMCRRP
ncbi:MAG: Extracellular ligand-binding receptor [Polaromonas sp.]|nr:Extracellular ligand-binding receptor [Polaromonas sp.]